ncbi:hypothetical protein DDB_G0279143 [Dictyostelium discoideum AX4]|uniref:Transmembrane protein n=1 Tax=Dictyostelium discoideum TaxID=44689 RepID=Q54X81_DICDI|nr:hypothetical protein DDB_G0279143 [Dictyostelium discoideum AX4]EAL67871.1 hypothetical protein DDB_G0279143 [Dictyostelium discoideum AX4]|eukprot:XP_641847.1 hypothetical protein DDB_G0279143 [Dictyostelium discoideum AX4]
MKWVDTTNKLDFEDPLGWDLNIKPYRNDSAIISLHGSMVISNKNTSVVGVNSLFVDNGSTFLCYTQFWSFENITIGDTVGGNTGFSPAIFINTRYFGSPLIEIRGFLILASTNVFYSNIKLYGEGVLTSYDGCTKPTCASLFLDTNVTFFEKSQLLLNNITSSFFDLTFYNDSNTLILEKNGTLILNDQSILKTYNKGYLLINNILTMNDNSSMIVSNKSMIHVNGECKVRNCNISYSVIQSLGSFEGNGDYFKLFTSTVAVIGNLTFKSNETNIDHGTVNVYSGGNLSIYNKLFINSGSNFIIEGDLIINDFSTVEAVSSRIVLLNNGKLLLSPLSNAKLDNIDFDIQNGTLTSIGDMYLSSNTLISNKDTFLLSSNIFETTKSSKIENTGSMIINHIGNGNGNGNDDKSFSIGVNLINSGGLIQVGNDKIGKNIEILDYIQHNNNSILLINKNSIISSNETIKIQGGLVYGNGTFNSSINHSNGNLLSLNQTNQINITNNYIQGENATIIILINSKDDFSKLNINKFASLNGNIEIRISKTLINDKEQQIDIINFNNEENDNDDDDDLNTNLKLVSSSSTTTTNKGVNFKNIKFNSYDQETGETKEITEESDCVKSKSSTTSFSVLVGCSDNSKLSGGQIAGIVIGCAVFVALLGTLLHFRSRISLRVRHSNLVTKMKTRK